MSAVLQFPSGAIYAPAPTEIERLTLHHEEVRRNHIWILGAVPKAVILGPTLAVGFVVVALSLAFAGLGWLADAGRRAGG